MGPVHLQRPFDGGHLAAQPFIGKARTPAGDRGRLLPQQGAQQGAGGGGVADAHLPGGQQSEARLFL